MWQVDIKPDLKPPDCFPKWLQFFVPTSSGWKFWLHLHRCLVILSVFFILIILIGLWRNLILVLICISLMAKDGYFNSSSSLLSISLSWVFILLSFKSSLDILDVGIYFIRCVFCRYFLPLCGLAFHSLNNVFQRTDALHSFEVQFINFFDGPCFLY